MILLLFVSCIYRIYNLYSIKKYLFTLNIGSYYGYFTSKTIYINFIYKNLFVHLQLIFYYLISSFDNYLPYFLVEK